jgi:ubiquitin carboxyl-terminal hydrolase 5/13
VQLTSQVIDTVKGIMTAVSSAQQSEVKAWEEEILACEHSLTLEQVPLINPDDPCEWYADE